MVAWSFLSHDTARVHDMKMVGRVREREREKERERERERALKV